MDAKQFRHRPTRVDAVCWDGDLVAVREFIGQRDAGAPQVDIDSNGHTLWVTQRLSDGLNVFPVALRHWLVRSSHGVLSGISAARFARLYEPAPQLATV